MGAAGCRNSAGRSGLRCSEGVAALLEAALPGPGRTALVAGGLDRRRNSQRRDREPWRGIDVNAKGRHWSKPPAYLNRQDAEGRIHWPKRKGGMPRLKFARFTISQGSASATQRRSHCRS